MWIELLPAGTESTTAGRRVHPLDMPLVPAITGTVHVDVDTGTVDVEWLVQTQHVSGLPTHIDVARVVQELHLSMCS